MVQLFAESVANVKEAKGQLSIYSCQGGAPRDWREVSRHRMSLGLTFFVVELELSV